MSILFITPKLYSQTQNISGIVSDSKGTSIPGASIALKGLGTGTVSNIDGEYNIGASKSDTLVFSFIGMETKFIPVGNQTKIDVVLSENIVAIDEVIAVGYSSKKRTEISSSIVNISAEDLSTSSSTALDGADLLQGKVAGLTIMDNSYEAGGQPAIRLRGTGSINASSEPLWVIDGIISSADAFNPNDVETMTVMKDAGATGLYGSKAAGGVIVVTTKSGKAGKGKWNVNAAYGFNSPWWGNFEGLMSSSELYDYYLEAYLNDNDYRKSPLTEKDFIKNVVGGRTRDEVVATNFDWLGVMYPNGATQRYSVSHTGGNEKTTHYLSLNYNSTDGTVRGNKDEKISGTLNLRHRVNDKFKFDARIFTSIRNTEFPILVENLRYASFDSPYNEDGSLKDLKDIKNDWIGKKTTNQLLHEQIGNENKLNQVILVPSISLDYQITSNLKFSSSTKYNYNAKLYKEYKDGRSWAHDSNINKGYLTQTNAFVSQRFSTSRNLLTNGVFGFNDSYGKHSISALAGIEYQNRFGDGFKAKNTGIVNGISVLSATTGIPTVSGTPNEITRLSYFSQANYDLSKKYFLTASYRRDGSSKFGSNNRFGNFYAASVSWLISNEKFMEPYKKVITNLKLRASYGVTGNDNFPNYSAVDVYALSGADYNYQSGASPDQFSNPDLTWEKAYTRNFGVDLSLWKKIDVTLDVYHIANKDILYEVPVDPTTGFEYAWQNIGDVMNRGYEFSIGGNIIKTDNFKWSTSLSLAYNYNEVVALTDEVEKGIVDTKRGSILKIGEDINSAYALDYIGADPATGRATWNTVDENGKINGTTHWLQDPNISYKTKNMSPRYTGGLNNKIKYKGFTLDMMFSYAGGFYTNISNLMWFRHGEKAIQGQSRAALKNRWKQPGDNAYFPKIYYGVYGKTENRPNKAHGSNIVKGDYIKINYLSLGYSIPKNIAENLKLSDINIYCRCNNPYLFVFDKNFTFTTPEAGGYGGTEVVNNNLRPVIRSVVFGVNISF